MPASVMYVFFLKRETGCIFFLEPDILTFEILHCKIKLSFKTIWKQLTFHYLGKLRTEHNSINAIISIQYLSSVCTSLQSGESRF